VLNGGERIGLVYVPERRLDRDGHNQQVAPLVAVGATATKVSHNSWKNETTSSIGEWFEQIEKWIRTTPQRQILPSPLLLRVPDEPIMQVQMTRRDDAEVKDDEDPREHEDRLQSSRL